MYDVVLDYYKGNDHDALKFFTMPIPLFDGLTPMQLMDNGRKEELKNWISTNLIDESSEVARGCLVNLNFKVLSGINVGRGPHYRNIHFTCSFPGGASHSFSFTTRKKEHLDEFMEGLSSNKEQVEEKITSAISQQIFKYLINDLAFDIRNGEISK